MPILRIIPPYTCLLNKPTGAVLTDAEFNALTNNNRYFAGRGRIVASENGRAYPRNGVSVEYPINPNSTEHWIPKVFYHGHNFGLLSMRIFISPNVNINGEGPITTIKVMRNGAEQTVGIFYNVLHPPVAGGFGLPSQFSNFHLLFKYSPPLISPPMKIARGWVKIERDFKSTVPQITTGISHLSIKDFKLCPI